MKAPTFFQANTFDRRIKSLQKEAVADLKRNRFSLGEEEDLDEDAEAIVAMVGKEKAALLIFEPDTKAALWIVYYYVRPKFRGRGIATRLIRILCGIAKERKAKKVGAFIHSRNASSNRAARKAGMSISGYYMEVSANAKD